jgi:hypothetical protein
MKRVFSVLAALLFGACICFAQAPTPPADGVGLGNSHLSPNSSDSNILTMSPDVNSVITNSNGSVTGDKGVPAFAGAPAADTATRVNSQGPAVFSGNASATSSWRRANDPSHVVQHTQSKENVNTAQGSTNNRSNLTKQKNRSNDTK